MQVYGLTVHPHIRGAYFCSHFTQAAFSGSSPHTWGIPHAPFPGVYPRRFIPTYVGHTSACCGVGWLDPVHPHIRGAYNMHIATTKGRCGSSPHTWGIQAALRAATEAMRFIPTYVGHTSTQLSWCFGFSVHPHIRGAYPDGALYSWNHSGSSPHTWGIHWTAVRKMAGFSHFSYDFTRKSYFVQGLVFFGVIGAEAFPTHRRGRNQCLSGAHGGSVRNL